MTEMRDDLDDLLAAFDRDRSYTTEFLLKENALERTEVVSDPSGRRFIRKYINVENGQEHPYERLAGVAHPNLQRVCETARVGGKLVVVCEYVDGLNLRDHVHRYGPAEKRDACMWTEEICSALGLLHSLPGGSVIHRDVNPGNIIISNGHAVLVDLGIARNYQADSRQDTHVWGTEGYTAPEQFGFRQTDARADVYSAGMCLRFMLTGANPSEQADVPPWAVTTIATATDMDPEDRYRSAMELADALRSTTAGRTVGDPGTAATSSSQEYAAASPEASHHVYSEAGFGGFGTAPASGSGHDSAVSAATSSTSSQQGSSLVGATKRSFGMKVLWRAWQVFVALVFLGILHVVPSSFAQSPALGNLIGGVAGVVFAFLVPMALSTNFANVNDRLPWLEKNRHVRIFLTMLASWGVFFLILALVLYSGIPYVRTS